MEKGGGRARGVREEKKDGCARSKRGARGFSFLSLLPLFSHRPRLPVPQEERAAHVRKGQPGQGRVEGEGFDLERRERGERG